MQKGRNDEGKRNGGTASGFLPFSFAWPMKMESPRPLAQWNIAQPAIEVARLFRRHGTDGRSSRWNDRSLSIPRLASSPVTIGATFGNRPEIRFAGDGIDMMSCCSARRILGLPYGQQVLSRIVQISLIGGSAGSHS
jgi:hypothetical protein